MRSPVRTHRHLSIRGAARAAASLAIVILCVVACPTGARAQLGTGGTTGTTVTGSLAMGDFFVGIQKVLNANLNPRDTALFLNKASCECKRDVWVKLILASSQAVTKAATVAPTATVSMYLGGGCNVFTVIPSCLQLATTTFADFRLNGLIAKTTVDVLAKQYGVSTTIDTGTGGVSGTGGDTGTGGDAGSGGVSGTGGAPAVGNSGTCAAIDSTLPLWVIVESSPGLQDIVVFSIPLPIDTIPPPAPTMVPPTDSVTPLGQADEALIVNWDAIDKTDPGGSDLAGYQVYCTRADQFQVFPSGSFSTSIDFCDTGDTTESVLTKAFTDVNTDYLCSSLASTSDTSARLKILENGIYYSVGVAAVDTHGNASPMMPEYGRPVATRNFYHEYRQGMPEGQATGGDCAVTDGGDRVGAAALLFAIVGAAFVGGRRARRRRR